MTAALGLAGWMLALLGLIATAIFRHRARVRHRLIARACHELRGPLTAARLGLELGRRHDQLPGPGLRAIGLELERASLALEDLMSVSESAGQAPLGDDDAEAVDAAGLLGDCVEAWRLRAAARGVEVRLDVPRRPVLVRGARLRLAQAVANLIANSVEHGGGPVEVSLNAGPDRAKVEVLDNGPGLAAPVSELARRGRGGGRHGHGLAVAAEAAAAYGGTLTAAPSARGARLVLSLPTVQPEDRVSEAQS